MKKQRLIAMVISMIFLLTGCLHNNGKGNIRIESEEEQTGILDEGTLDQCLRVYQSIYDDAGNDITDVQKQTQVVQGIGSLGYVAIDVENKIDMACAEQLQAFIQSKKQTKDADCIIFRIAVDQKFWVYRLLSRGEKVTIEQQCIQYHNQQMEISDLQEYDATEFCYTQEGYLFIEGYWVSNQMSALLAAPEEEHIAFRVEALDAAYKAMNEAYIEPISYSLNNVFLVDWDAEHWGQLDFYDIFVKFYQECYQKECPYKRSEDLSVGMEYQIPQDEFENVIRMHFPIEVETLRKLLRYNSDTQTYLFRPRSMDEIDYAEIPYSEVVGCVQNADGSMTLTVNAVFPLKNTSRLFAHMVTVKNENGTIHYLQNRIINNSEGEHWWHSDRYTDEEWQERYGISDENNIFPKPETELLTNEEKEQIDASIMEHAESIWDVYEHVELEDGLFYTSNIKDFTIEQRSEVVNRLANSGVVAVTDGEDMRNGDLLVAFYESVQEGVDADVTVYSVLEDGLLTGITFVHRNRQLQTYYVGVRPDENKRPSMIGRNAYDIKFINYTEKGYFIYAYKYIPVHASLCNYWRVKPLSDTCKALTEKYVSGLDYQKYNLLLIDWNTETASDILMDGIFEDLYLIAYGEPYRESTDCIPGDLFERIMTTYLPVTIEQLRNAYTYDAEKHVYYQDIVYNYPYSPFGEVVDYQYNADGTLSLYVDGVWPDKNSDCAFVNKLVVQTFSDGTFRILSNHVEEKELELPTIRPRDEASTESPM